MGKKKEMPTFSVAERKQALPHPSATVKNKWFVKSLYEKDALNK